ncbi:MAG: TatD family hydrolase [Kiritimatiellae bacterium]|jgi:TatD DNase family protein|nr:TatD family hydrolase [Kiritimatiellia bacterium]
MLVDTHVHFDGLLETDAPVAFIERALARGVKKMIAVGGSARGNEIALQTAAERPENVRAAVGFDRSQALGAPDLAGFARMLENRMAAAVGETGLDFHAPVPPREAQKELFRLMLQKARERVLPVIIHNREADREILEILEEHVRLWKGPADKIGVCHCFTGTETSARRFLSLGFYISFSGILTFRARHSAALAEAARVVPDNRLLIETDAPFLAPEPLRGRVNEPANVRYVARALADIRGKTLESVAAVTTKNAENLFWDKK